jgi:YegS/Rv2252/BmrU family lipid kinase
MRVRAIVNPNSSHGRTREAWPKLHAALEGALGPVEFAFTSGQLDATTKTREALIEGVDLIIAVGGDGTVNEVVNGFFAPPVPGGPDVPLRPQAALALLVSGTGGDFRKTFDIGTDLQEQVRRIAEGQTRAIDVGRIDYVAWDGAPGARYFINIASFGLSGLVVGAVNKAWLTKRISGRFAFLWASLTTLMRYKMPRVRLTVDDRESIECGCNIIAVCNGRYFGGGMHVAPMARPDDGVFEVVAMHDMTRLDQIKDPNAIYRGEHIKSPKVFVISGRKAVAEPLDREVLLDVDGEGPGRLPATFAVIPGGLQFRS